MAIKYIKLIALVLISFTYSISQEKKYFIDSIDIHSLSFNEIKFNELINKEISTKYNFKEVVKEMIDEGDNKFQVKYLTDGDNYFCYTSSNKFWNASLSTNRFILQPYGLKVGNEFKLLQEKIPLSSLKTKTNNKYKYVKVKLYSLRENKLTKFDGSLIFVISITSNLIEQIQFKPTSYDSTPNEL